LKKIKKGTAVRKIILLLICGFFICLTPATAEQHESPAQKIIEEYLELPHFKLYDENRLQRLQILDKLKAMPEEAVYEISLTLPKIENSVQRVELIEVLGQIPTPESGKILIFLLDDPEVEIRRQAIQSLRLLSSRINRAGVVDVSKGPDFLPKVEGLVPYLIETANDEDVSNRILALFALADTRDSKALAELNNRLSDPNERVRFTAVCLLTEFNNASGLPELKKKLLKLRETSPDEEITYYADAEHLIVSFQRITGESLGKIPPIPNLLSSIKGQEESKKNYDKLLKAWDEWWEKKDKNIK
jgi:HEAT repeat protein